MSYLLRTVSRFQAAQAPDDPTPMLGLASMQVLVNSYSNLLDDYDIPTGFAVYCSVSDNYGNGHAFGIDTRDPTDAQLADVGSGIYRCEEGMSAREIFDTHVNVLNNELAKKGATISCVDLYTVAPSEINPSVKEIILAKSLSKVEMV